MTLNIWCFVDQAYIIFRLLAFSQAALLMLVIGLYYPSRLGRITALMVFGVACYLIIPVTETLFPGSQISFGLALVATMLPSIMWVMGYWFFTEGARIPPWLLMVTLFYVTLSAVNWQANTWEIDPDILLFTFSFVPQFIKLALIAHLVYMALADHDVDLVTPRQRLRRPVAVVTAGATAMVILVEVWAGDQTPLFIENLGALLMFILVLSMNVYLLRLGSNFLTVTTTRATVEPQESPDSNRVMAELSRIMEVERYYANHGATISDLAGELSLPEYRLRKLINQELGHRNFNQFLNDFRIKEASQRLLSNPDQSILTIALDVGFSSLSSFNKAFKDRQGQTPSDFRLTDSLNSE